MKIFPARTIISTVILIALAAGCSTVKQEDPDKGVREFLLAFQKALTQPETDVMTFFQTQQSRETILAAVKVLQNKTTKFVHCDAGFENASLTRNEQGDITAVVPVVLETVGIPDSTKNETMLSLQIRAKEKTFVITAMDGEQFYQAFTALRNASEWAEEREAELTKREPIYAMARALREKADSVVWYATYKNKNYFYAINGSWENYFIETDGLPNYTYKMGLMDSAANVLIPFEYDMVGTLGFEFPDMAEVKSNNKYGYFDVAKAKLVVEPQYDMIIPYQKDSAWAIVKSDTTFGWLNNNFAYREGFPSEAAMHWVKDFKYLTKQVTLKQGNQTFCEIANKDYAGYGIVVPPSYYVLNNLFDEIVGGINTSKVPMNGWTDYMGKNQSIVQEIGDKFHALVTVVQERYLGGREEFYGESKVVFVTNNYDVMGVTKVPTDKDIYITMIDSTLVEVEATSPGYWFDPSGKEIGIPLYTYYRIHEGFKLKPLKSNRQYAFTEFVKMDSSYITGDFKIITGYEAAPPAELDENGNPIEDYYESEPIYTYVDMLSASTLEDIRDEILATYGMRFYNSRYSTNWYDPRYESREEFADQITPIDKHNLEFLDKQISALRYGSKI